MSELDDWPVWLRDIRATVSVTPHYVLWGNVTDQHVVPGDAGPVPHDTGQALWTALQAEGYEVALSHHPVAGLTVLSGAESMTRAGEMTSLNVKIDRPLTLPELTRLVADVASNPIPGALVLLRQTRAVVNVEQLTPTEQEFFAAMENAASCALPRLRQMDGRERMVHNPVLWLIDREQDIPHWLLSDNEAPVRTVVIPMPGREQRRAMAELVAPRLPGATAGSALHEALQDLTDRTDGMMLREIDQITVLARDQGIPIDDVEAAIRAHRVGVADNPWRRDYLRKAVADAEATGSVANRVLGQPAALTKAFDILKRSVLGLSGAQAKSSARRPRGVLLFVGPTGTGKTELAKALTELIFGEGVEPLRFDMSEFRADHSEARLIGAPPGYVGYDAGGELTNALRRRPFSLVLFDEIDKAHPRILDKFLQVLDEGRLTDGRGATVSFEESLLVFTSNAGMDEVNAEVRSKGGGMDALPSYEELARRLQQAIEDYFVADLQRPELLNRFGDNLVVFDFIRPPVPRQIFDGLIGNLVERVQQAQDLRMEFVPEVLDEMADACTARPLMGGRGIANKVESLVNNPIGRALFAADFPDGATVRVTSWSMAAGVARVEIE